MRGQIRGHRESNLTCIRIYVGREIAEKLPDFFFCDVEAIQVDNTIELNITNIRERKRRQLYPDD